MTSRRQVWKCNVCGNIVEVLHKGADALVCCGESMVLMNAKNENEGNEKHKPVIFENIVKVGSVAHPMVEGHYIEWVEGVSKNGEVCKKFLDVDDLPEVEFSFEVVLARCYCNVHGLWIS